MRITKLILSSLLTLLLFGTVAGGFLFFELKKDLPNVETLKTVELQQPMQIFTADNKLIGEVGEQRRIPVALSEIPQGLINAVIATEDSRFYEHFGLDPIGIMRAVSVAVANGGATQGASTITQQLARNFFLTREKTLLRKAREAILALEIEQTLTKEEILSLYLNKIYLGHRAYGVAAAAYTYFGKELKDLTLSEMAIIAGLPKAPSSLNPLNSVERATERRNIVLGRMLEMDFISKEEYNQAKNEPIKAAYHGSNLDFSADYVTEMVRQQMVKAFGEEEAYNKGYKVFTTLLSKDQIAAQNALRENLIAYDIRHGYRKPAYLWKQSETAWSTNKITNYLKTLFRADPFVPAAVIAKNEEGLTFLLKNGEEAQLNKKALAWAKKNQPQVGDLIWVRQDEAQQWTLGQVPEANSALVSLNSNNGAIEALVGGFSFSQSKFNRATQSLVQVGSVIKPFIYAAALERGLTLATVLQDAPIVLRQNGEPDWRPKNSPNKFEGPMRIRQGLGLSKNMIAIRTMKMAGIPFASDFLQRFGFRKEQYFASPALALGAASFTPMQLARGYAAINNGGFLVDPFVIEHIEDNNGKVIFVAEPKIACPRCDNLPVVYGKTAMIEALKDEPAIDSETIDNEGEGIAVNEETGEIEDITPNQMKEGEEESINGMLVQKLNRLDEYSANFMENAKEQVKTEQAHYAPRVLDGGVAFLLRSALHSAVYGESGQPWLGTSWRIRREIHRNDIGGKTGTTNENKTAWYAGFGANVTTAVYIGFDDYSRKLGRNEGGAVSAMPAWISYMKTALQDTPQQGLLPPSNVVSRSIDPASGLLAAPGQKNIKEYFLNGTEPKQMFIPQNQGYLPMEQTTTDEGVQELQSIF